MWLRPGWAFVDAVLSLVIAAMVLWGALRLVREITDILMESVPRHLDAAEVERAMSAAAAGVAAVHDLHIWTISSGLLALSAHLVVEPGAVGRNDAILTSVKAALRERFGIAHTTIQIESADYANDDDACDRAH
jgi:cobalt-zinc-cadmium efflux system protein